MVVRILEPKIVVSFVRSKSMRKKEGSQTMPKTKEYPIERGKWVAESGAHVSKVEHIKAQFRDNGTESKDVGF